MICLQSGLLFTCHVHWARSGRDPRVIVKTGHHVGM
jgi:hypothetical protein